MRQRRAWVAACLLLFAVGGCGSDDDALTVFAASSLTDAFTDLADAFEASDGGMPVELSFAGSTSLREQIIGGAPADVFASANLTVMDDAVGAGAVETPVVFARNTLQIAVPIGNPGEVDGLDDFADDDLLLGLCAVEVPCGALADEALSGAGVDARPDTREPDVRALLTKIEGGELDAGIVYVTDVLESTGVEGIDIPSSLDVVTDYPIAVVADTGRPDDAARFVAFVRSDAGRAILAEHGFLAP